MFKTLIILYALSSWETEIRPNPGRSVPHWLVPMPATTQPARGLDRASECLHLWATLTANRPGPRTSISPARGAHTHTSYLDTIRYKGRGSPSGNR